MSKFVSRFSKIVQEQFPELNKARLLVAVSGGIDSMVLTDLLLATNFSIGIVHCNFLLRGVESDEDEQFVRTFAETQRIPFFSTRFDTKSFATNAKISTQEAARILRYHYFEEIRTQQAFEFILTAHHLNDSIETVLFHLTRGTGIDGLLGIPKRNGRILRPLLCFSKEEILEYAAVRNLSWREDASNAKTDYTRNKIRHELLPIFKSLNPSFEASFHSSILAWEQTQSLATDAAAAVLSQVVQDSNGCKKLYIPELLKFPNYQAYLQFWLADFGFHAWNDIYNLPFGETGKHVFSEDYVLTKDRDFLLLSLKKEEPPIHVEIKTIPFAWTEPIAFSGTYVESYQKSTRTEIYVDSDMISGNLNLRNYVQTDKFAPEGMSAGTKSVGKFLRDEKVSLEYRKKALVLCDSEQVIWVVGYRANRNYLATTQTKSILKFTLYS